MKSLSINKLIKYCSLVMLISLSITKAKASHYAAADLYLTYIGAGVDGCTGTTEYKYTVTFDIYKACEAGNAGLPNAVTINYASANGGVNNTLQMNTPRIDTLDGLCDNFKKDNSCRKPANTNLPGFVRHRFEATLTLPSAQTDWRFWWRGGNRNQSIENIQNPQTTFLYIEAGLNNLTKYNNSTPRFVIDPLPYICVNQPATYLNGPYDPNGDSLNIISQTPFDNANVPLTYSAGYTLANPLAATAGNPYRVNPQTGTATFTPTKQGLFVLGFRCDEYERGTGIPLGYIMRDVQISILQCAAPPPPIDSLPSTVNNGNVIRTNDGNAVFACPGNDMSFEMTTTSQSPSSNVYMEANTNTIPNSTFTTVGSGTSSVTGTFSWTPTQADVGEHTLIITSKDSTCTGSGFSIVLKNYTVLLIKVVNGLDAGEDIPICELNPKPEQLYVKGSEYLSVQWTDISGGPAIGLSDPNIHNPIADPGKATTYVVYTPDLKGDQCKVRDTVSLYIDTSNAIDALPQNPVIQCRPDYMQLEAVIKGKPPVNNVKCGLSKPTLCDDPDSVLLYGSTVYGKIGYDTTGAASPIMNNDKYTKKIQYLLHRSELHEYGLRSATINQIGFECIGNTIPTYKYGNFTISVKCTEKNELKSSDGFETGLFEVYYSDDELLDDGWHDYKLDRPYTWDTTKNLVIEICYSDNEVIVQNCTPTAGGKPPILRYSPTTYVSGLTLTPDNIVDKGVCNIVKSADIKEVAARPVFRFAYCEADPLPFTINWTPGKYLSDSTIEQPLAYVPTSTDYVVETFGRNGCTIRDTVSIYVPKHDFDVFPKDSSICFGDKTPMYITNGFSYKWYEYDAATDSYNDASQSLNCTDCGYVIASPKKTTTYRISVSDSVWCYDTLEVTLKIMDLPKVRVLNSDTTIKYGQSIKLLATGARMYNWSPVSTLNNPNISYPIATPTEATRYIVGGLAANGCRSFDTLYVSVDYKDNLFVPSAFSPNGDGKNDVFRVANVTFQRIVEFRVFNRWGQEIFSGAGNNVSWDGTWKGTPQNVGTYTYLIRVASPDGEVETYKGDVTLIK